MCVFILAHSFLVLKQDQNEGIARTYTEMGGGRGAMPPPKTLKGELRAIALIYLYDKTKNIYPFRELY